MQPDSVRRILITNFYADFGGGEFALLNHARWLLRRGVQVYVCLFNDGPFVGGLLKEGCKVQVINHRLDCGPRGAWITAGKLVPKLIGVFRHIRPDYIIAYTAHEMPFVALAGRLCGIPVFYRDQGRPKEEGAPLSWRDKWLPILGRRILTGVLPTTKIKAAHLVRSGIPSEKVKVVYLGVNANHFKHVQDVREKLEKEFGIPSGVPVLGIFGRLIEWKGQGIFLSAFANLNAKHAHALVVGGTQLNDGQGRVYELALKEQAKELQIQERVHFTGFRTDVPTLMSCCDIVCHASWNEPFGLVLVEAMMCGKPVVASDVSGPREIVVPGETGFLFPAGDHVAMARYLDRLLSDADLRAWMGQNARRRALELFDLNKNLQLLNEAIEGFLRRNR